jgi:uncharacterized damage-inducible protein DinB
MKSIHIGLLCVLMVLGLAAFAQSAQSSADTSTNEQNPLSAYNRKIFAGVKMILLRSADKMPEENYGFKPVDTVRSYGQILGHVADSQYHFCSTVLGEENPSPKIEKTKTSKADIIAALKDAFAYCDKAYNGMTDASATQMVKMMGGDVPKLGALGVNNVHTVEHYGNLITYMRMKNIVPPTSEPGFMQQPKNETKK